MTNLTGLKFQKSNIIYYFKGDPSLELKKGDFCIVETSLGIDIGEVVITNQQVEEKDLATPLKTIIRKATPEDLENWSIIKQNEEKAFNICKEKIKKYGLPMKLLYVKSLLDSSRLIFYFISSERVDFRELVKDLVQTFKTKIELRQIGVRDGIKLVGSMGICGREVCCVSFIQKFSPIHINMAKIQKIALNQAKVSGICGRLMCCLAYENEFYKETLQKYPEIGDIIETKNGKGKVTEINILKKYLIIEQEEGETKKRIKIGEEELLDINLKNNSLAKKEE
ncbi:MAG: stage 0 sporulation family protein [Candidatus Caldatribacteriota bacterium]